jgi:hypothetical protein
MGLREEITKKIEKKEQELATLYQQANDCQIYISSLQDVLKMLPRDTDGGKEIVLRAGSLISKARDILKKTQKPLHVTDLLTALGRPNTPKARLALSGSLSAYVRRDEVFTRPEPNTFGLKEFEKDASGKEEEILELEAASSTPVRN